MPDVLSKLENPLLAFVALCGGCFLLVVSIRLLCAARRERRIEGIKRDSQRYRSLVRLRNEYEPRFHWGVAEIPLRISCNSKAQFDRFDRVRRWSEIVDFAGQNEREIGIRLHLINRNRELAREYTSRVAVLPAGSFTGDSGWIEADLCRQQELHPETQLTLHLSVSYVSPAGRNRYYREFVYGQDKIVAALQQSRKKASAVDVRKRERAKMTPKLRYQVLERDNFRCVRCGASAADGVKLHVDHIIPVSRGGKTVMSNLQTLCETCNLGKGSDMPAEGTEG